MNNKFRFLLFQSETENISVNALVKDETIWLTQKALAQLFGVQTPAISKHLKNIFKEGELEEKVVASNMEITTAHGAIPDKTQTKETRFYNLDAIISVGVFVQIKVKFQEKRLFQRLTRNMKNPTRHKKSFPTLITLLRRCWIKEAKGMSEMKKLKNKFLYRVF